MLLPPLPQCRVVEHASLLKAVPLRSSVAVALDLSPSGPPRANRAADQLVTSFVLQKLRETGSGPRAQSGDTFEPPAVSKSPNRDGRATAYCRDTDRGTGIP